MMEIKTKVLERLHELGYDFAQYNFEDFLAFLERDSGKQFEIREIPGLLKRCKVWAYWFREEGGRREIFLLDSAIPSCLRRHILAHELGHFIMGHATAAIQYSPGMDMIFPDQALARAIESTGMEGCKLEAEAEMVAVILDAFEDDQQRFGFADTSFIDRLWANR